MRRISQRLALVAALLAAAPVALAKEGSADSFPSDVASVWFGLLYEVVRSEGTPPPPASRIYGVTAVALYESIVSGTEENKSLVGQLNDLSELPDAKKKYHWPTVANAALAQTIRGIFASLKAENLDAINALEADFNARFQGQPRFDRSIAFGKEVADAVLAWAATDGFAEFTTARTSQRGCLGPGNPRRPVSTRTRCSLVGGRSVPWS